MQRSSLRSARGERVRRAPATPDTTRRRSTPPRRVRRSDRRMRDAVGPVLARYPRPLDSEYGKESDRSHVSIAGTLVGPLDSGGGPSPRVRHEWPAKSDLRDLNVIARHQAVAQEGDVMCPVTLHFRMACSCPTPRGHTCTVQCLEQGEKTSVSLGEMSDNLAGLKSKIPFEGTKAAALEVDPAQPRARLDSVPIVRLAMQPAPVEADTFEREEPLVVDVTEKGTVFQRQSRHHCVVVEHLPRLHQHRAERRQRNLSLIQGRVKAAQ